MKKIFGLGLMALFISLSGCSGDDSSEPANNNNNNGQGTITAVINGEEWEGTVKSATLLKIQGQGMRFDITAEGDGQRIQLACEAAYGTTMPLAAYTFDQEAMGNALFANAYLVGNNSYQVHFPQTGALNITSFNDSNKKTSGTFEFTNYKVGTVEGIDVPELYVVTDGEFHNVVYTVFNQ